MINITDFSLDASNTILYITYSLESGAVTSSLKLFIGDRYLSSDFVDLTALAVADGENVQIALSIDDVLLKPHYSSDVYDGIFTITIESTDDGNAEAILLNALYTSICFANMVIAHDSLDKWNELNLLYLNLQAAIVYTSIPQIAEAIGAYSKVESICKSKSSIYHTTDVSECGQGMGCWIVNGVYIIKR